MSQSKQNITKIGFGGGCHWCTEAVFQALIGVQYVEQGYIASTGTYKTYSEGVIVHFDLDIIALKQLIAIHLNTHKSTVNHSMRLKYRSAIYTFSEEQAQESQELLYDFQNQFQQKLITKVLEFSKFKDSEQAYINYYDKDPEKPFCQRFIAPKLLMLLKQYSRQIKPDKLCHLKQDQAIE